jgi:hypothetical protein
VGNELSVGLLQELCLAMFVRGAEVAQALRRSKGLARESGIGRLSELVHPCKVDGLGIALHAGQLMLSGRREVLHGLGVAPLSHRDDCLSSLLGLSDAISKDLVHK